MESKSHRRALGRRRKVAAGFLALVERGMQRGMGEEEAVRAAGEVPAFMGWTMSSAAEAIHAVDGNGSG